MSHIVKSCPLTKLNGGLSRLHSADEDAVLWLTSYGSRHAYKKKKNMINKLSYDLHHAFILLYYFCSAQHCVQGIVYGRLCL